MGGESSVGGDVRIWASPQDRDIVETWARGFEKAHPGVTVRATFHGPESTVASLYTGVADVALLARELRLPTESMAFEWVKLYKPTLIDVAAVAPASDRIAAPLAVFVHASNPIRCVSLTDLRRIFGDERAARYPTWGDLGSTGPLTGQAIRPYSLRVDEAAAIFFRSRVLNDSYKWNETLQERETMSEVISALRRDVSGIAYGPLRGMASQDVRAIDVSLDGSGDGGACRPLDAAHVEDGSYPLSRSLSVAIDLKPGTTLGPHVEAFLKYVLSESGQQTLADSSAYRPLHAPAIRAQIGKLR